MESTRRYRGPETPLPPGWLERKPEPGTDTSRLEQLLDEDPPMSAVKVWRYLDAVGRWPNARGQWNRGAWQTTRGLARKIGIAEVTVRRVALPWLREHGWIHDEDVTIDGEDRLIHWCLWLLPLDLSGEECPLGHGLVLTGEGSIGPAKPRPRRKSTAQDRAVSSPECADNCAHKSTPISSNQIQRDGETTTTGRVVVVDRAAQGQGPGGQEVQQEIPPAPDLDPRIAGLLSEPADVADVAARYAEWVRANHPLDRIAGAIAEALAYRRVKGRVHSLAALADGIMRNWVRDGKATPRYSRPEPASGGSASDPPGRGRIDVEEARREEARKDRRRAAEAVESTEARRRARWESIGESRRSEIEAEWDRAHPPGEIPGEPAGIRKLRRKAGCLEAMDAIPGDPGA